MGAIRLDNRIHTINNKLLQADRHIVRFRQITNVQTDLGAIPVARLGFSVTV